MPAKGARGHRVRVTRGVWLFRGSGSLDFGPKQDASSACPQAMCAFRLGVPGLVFLSGLAPWFPKVKLFRAEVVGGLCTKTSESERGQATEWWVWFSR